MNLLSRLFNVRSNRVPDMTYVSEKQAHKMMTRALRRGNLPAIKAIAAKYRSTLDKALFKTNDVRTVAFLIGEMKMSPDAGEKKMAPFSYSRLHAHPVQYHAAKGHAEIVGLLVKAGANAGKNFEYQTPLKRIFGYSGDEVTAEELALRKGYRRVVDALRGKELVPRKQRFAIPRFSVKKIDRT